MDPCAAGRENLCYAEIVDALHWRAANTADDGAAIAADERVALGSCSVMGSFSGSCAGAAVSASYFTSLSYGQGIRQAKRRT